MNGYTPGEWRVGDRSTKTKGLYILGGHNREIANVWLHPDYMAEERETDAANATLIAAAPELVEALKLVRSIITEGAAVGFNPMIGGDWAERLYLSQRDTHAALSRAGVTS